MLPRLPKRHTIERFRKLKIELEYTSEGCEQVKYKVTVFLDVEEGHKLEESMDGSPKPIVEDSAPDKISHEIDHVHV